MKCPICLSPATGEMSLLTMLTAIVLRPRSQISDVSSLEETLSSYGITDADYADGEPVITYEQPSPWGTWLNLIGIFLPALLILGFFLLHLPPGPGQQ